MLKWLEIIVRTVVSTLCTQRSLAPARLPILLALEEPSPWATKD